MSDTKNKKGDRSPRGLIIFVLHMYKQLTHEQRYVIYLGLQEGRSQKAIARLIGVHPSEQGDKAQQQPPWPLYMATSSRNGEMEHGAAWQQGIKAIREETSLGPIQANPIQTQPTTKGKTRIQNP